MGGGIQLKRKTLLTLIIILLVTSMYTYAIGNNKRIFDVNEDGLIDIKDIYKLINSYGNKDDANNKIDIFYIVNTSKRINSYNKVFNIKDSNKATWIWSAVDILIPETKEKLMDNLNEMSINRLFLNVGFENKKHMLNTYKDEYKEFIKSTGKNISVEALYGCSKWVEQDYDNDYEYDMKKQISIILDYNKEANEDEKFDAIHLDVEPHILNGWEDGSKLEVLLNNYLDLLKLVREDINNHNKENNDDIKLVIDFSPYFLINLEEYLKNNINEDYIEYNNKKYDLENINEIFDIVLNLVDEISLMNYTDQSDWFKDLTITYLNAVENYNYKNNTYKKVSVASEFNNLEKNNLMDLTIDDINTYYRKPLELFKNYRCFNNLSVHSYDKFYHYFNKKIKLNKLIIDKKSPQMINEKINFTVDAIGVDLKFKYQVYRHESLIYDGEFTDSNTFQWNPNNYGGYDIVVTVKDKYNSVEKVHSAYNSYFVDGNLGMIKLPSGYFYIVDDDLAINNIIPDKKQSQEIGENITWTAEAIGESLVYKWYVYNYDKLVVETDYDISNEYEWKPTKSGNYRIGVTIKDINNNTKTVFADNYHIEDTTFDLINEDKENNDNINSAKDFSNNSIILGSIADRSDDIDYYKLSIDESKSYMISGNWWDKNYDGLEKYLILELYDESNNLLATSKNDNNYTVIIEKLEPSNYYLKIYQTGKEVFINIPYHIIIR